MRNDREEELQRLEQELLAEEEETAEAAEDREEELDFEALLEETDYETPDNEEPVVFRNASNNYGADLRNYATGYKAYNADRTDTDLEELSRQVQEEPKAAGLIWVPIATVALIAAAVVYMLWLYFGGML